MEGNVPTHFEALNIEEEELEDSCDEPDEEEEEEDDEIEFALAHLENENRLNVKVETEEAFVVETSTKRQKK